MPRMISLSRMQPKMMMPDQPFFAAKAARLSPSRAQRLDPPPSTTSTFPTPSLRTIWRTRTFASKHVTVTAWPQKRSRAPKSAKDPEGAMQTTRGSLLNASHRSAVAGASATLLNDVPKPWDALDKRWCSAKLALTLKSPAARICGDRFPRCFCAFLLRPTSTKAQIARCMRCTDNAELIKRAGASTFGRDCKADDFPILDFGVTGRESCRRGRLPDIS
eukprot:scaffold1136_cov260-Pinguiococcus_pyrenoidosus.AAC.24